MIWVGMLMAGIALSLQGWAIKHDLHWQTIVFNFLCVGQLGHVMVIRSERKSLLSLGIFSNRPLIAAVAVALLLQLVITYTPMLQPVFKTEALTMYEFILVSAAALLVIVAVEIEKFISRTWKSGTNQSTVINS